MTRLRIGGLIPFTTLDYPGRLAAVVFCQGCPWRCVYCHNPQLLPADGQATHAWADVLAFLSRRRGLLEAVVFSGGEPSLQSGLAQAMRELREMGFLIGLHTAGMYPQRLARLLPLLDWVGLDIKAPRAAYGRITGVPGSGDAVYESLSLILGSGVAYQLRWTWHPQWLTAADLAVMQRELAALQAGPLLLQACRPNGLAADMGEIDGARLAELSAALCAEAGTAPKTSAGCS